MTITQPELSLTQEQFAKMATARFGPEVIDWAYECPDCGDIARVREFPPDKRMLAGIECIGCHVEGRGCKRTAYGMIPGPWAVMLPDGTIADCFPLAPAPSREPMTARLMGPADTVRYEVAKCGACGEPVSVHGHDGLAVGYVTDLGVRCGPCCGPKPAPSHAPQSAPQDSGAAPVAGSTDTPPGAAVGPARHLSVERRTPGKRQAMPGGGEILDMENWDYRVALTDDQAVLGYRDVDADRPVTVMFADSAAWQYDAFHDLAPDLGATLQHIAQYDLPITEGDVAHALLLIIEACAEDRATEHADAPLPSEPFLTGDDAEPES